MNLPVIAPPTDHQVEVWVLGVIAVGVMVLAGLAINAEHAGEASAWTAVLMAIINAIKEKWSQRSSDRTVQALTPGSNNNEGAGQ